MLQPDGGVHNRDNWDGGYRDVETNSDSWGNNWDGKRDGGYRDVGHDDTCANMLQTSGRRSDISEALPRMRRAR